MFPAPGSLGAASKTTHPSLPFFHALVTIRAPLDELTPLDGSRPSRRIMWINHHGHPRFIARRSGSAPRWSHGRPATSEEQSLKEQHRLEGLKLSARQEELEKTEEMQSRRGVEREKKISELEATLQAKGERCLQTEQELHESARELQEAAESWQSSRRECSEREAQSEAKAGELWSEMGELRRELKAEQLKWQGEQRAYQDQAERQRHQLSVCEASMQQEMQRREDQVEVDLVCLKVES